MLYYIIVCYITVYYKPRGIMHQSANPDHPFHVAVGNNKVPSFIIALSMNLALSLSLSLSMYVCIYIYTHICVYIYIYIYMHTHTH